MGEQNHQLRQTLDEFREALRQMSEDAQHHAEEETPRGRRQRAPEVSASTGALDRGRSDGGDETARMLASLSAQLDERMAEIGEEIRSARRDGGASAAKAKKTTTRPLGAYRAGLSEGEREEHERAALAQAKAVTRRSHHGHTTVTRRLYAGYTTVIRRSYDVIRRLYVSVTWSVRRWRRRKRR